MHQSYLHSVSVTNIVKHHVVHGHYVVPDRQSFSLGR